jgi:DNA-binding transcriptional LysR family regulator
MRNLDLTSLKLFVAVCDCQSITRAAEQAHIVGSAISKRLAALEATVGTPLLLRRRHGVQPTPAGQALLEHARSMLSTVDRIERDMAAYATGLRGHVRLLASASVMAESLADDVAAFLQDPHHRHIQIDLEERVSPEVLRGVREGQAALGICWDQADLQGLQARPYRRDHLAVVLPPDHPLSSFEALDFEQTLAYEHVGLPSNSAVLVMMQRFASSLGQSLAVKVQVTGFDAALRVVRAGLAISVVPQEVAAPFAAAQGLKVLPLNDAWARRQFALCFRSEAALSPAARLLMQFLDKSSQYSP